MPGWIVAWASAFSATPLSLLCVRSEGRLRGVLPILQRRWTLASPTNWHTPQFGFLAHDDLAALALVRALIRDAHAGVDLSFIDREDPCLEMCLQAARRRRWPTLVRTVTRSPYVDLSGGDWEGFCADLDRKLLKEVRRLRRRLDEQGQVSFEFTDGADDFEPLLEEGLAIEGSGWKARQGTAITSDPRSRRFYTEVARWAARRGELSMAFLRLDGRAIAFDLGLISAGRMFVLKGGFDPVFRRFGPGRLLTYESLRHAFARGYASYELLGDADPYKLAWTNTLRERVRFQAFDVATIGGAVRWVAWAHGRPRLRALRAAVRARAPSPRSRP